ncbi:MAG: hypothetical protein DWQ31_12890 [Planctomycetota bacterium]|nr:MAG: hypothetical protein DWQ31_12890 [Planctomycetota bacterium]
MWQHLIRNWIAGYATDQVRKAAVEKARQFAEDDATSHERETLAPVDVAVIASDSSVAGALSDQLADKTSLRGEKLQVEVGTLGRHRLVVADRSKSEARASDLARAVVEGHQPRWVFSATLARSLDDSLAAGDVVLATHLLGPQGERLATGVEVDARSVKPGQGMHLGAIATSGEQPEPASAADNALCFDAQSWAVAEVCRERKAPCLAVAGITATGDDAPSAEVANLHKQATIAGKLGAFTGAMMRRPSSVKDLWNEKEKQIVAADRLAQFLVGMIAQLPPPTDKSAEAD